MADTDSLDRDLAITKNDLKHLTDEMHETNAAIQRMDAKLDLMSQTYVTTAEFGRWKKEDYQPHKESVEQQFQRQGERLSKWLGIVIGAVLAGSVTLTVYLIVQAVGSTRP